MRKLWLECSPVKHQRASMALAVAPLLVLQPAADFMGHFVAADHGLLPDGQQP